MDPGLFGWGPWNPRSARDGLSDVVFNECRRSGCSSHTKARKTGPGRASVEFLGTGVPWHLRSSLSMATLHRLQDPSLRFHVRL